MIKQFNNNHTLNLIALAKSLLIKMRSPTFRFIRFTTIYLLGFLFQILPAFAQNSELSFEKLSQKNGLSNNAIKSLFQDKKGFMWFGTINGLNRYDGKEFLVYNHDPKNKKSISNDFINCISEDENQNLWIGTPKGINKYSPQTGEFLNFNNNPKNEKVFTSDFVTSLKIAANGLIWIGTKYKGIYIANTKKNKITHFELNKNQNATYITFIQEDFNKNIWVGANDGLYKISLKNNVIIKKEKTLDVFVNIIYEDRNQNLWYGTTSGLYKLPKSKLLNTLKIDFLNYTKTNATDDLSHNDVTSIYQDKAGELWIGTDGGGLNRSKSSKDLHFLHYQNRPDNTNSLAQNQIFAITQDVSGIVWIGTNDGVNKLKKSVYPFIHFQSNPQKPNSLENNNLASIKTTLINGKEYMICGSTGGTGLGFILSDDVHLNKENFKIYKDNDPVLSNRKYQSFLALSTDSLLVGTKSGIRLFNIKTKTFIPLRNALNKIPHDVIRKIFKDGNGLIWVGTSAGLFIWNPNADNLFKVPIDAAVINDNDYKSFIERSSLANIFSITQDAKSNVWVGTWGGGLLKFDANFPQRKPIRFIKADTENSLKNNYIVSLLYNDSHLWIGSAEGLSYLEKPETATLETPFKNVAISNKLNKIHIAGILADQHNNLWLATIHGIIKYNPKNNKTAVYEVSNGDLTKENYKLGLAKDKEGYLYFGGINGLVSFHPDSISSDRGQYPIVLTDFRIFNKNQKEQISNSSIYFKDKITLTPKEYAFSFSFSRLNYKISDEVNYAYILEGIDKSWITIKSDQRYATYSNLSPGKYVLKVKATDEYNVWSEPQKLLTITILTPWWLSWWAYTIYILALFAVMYAIVRYILEKERLQNNLAIERLEKEKVKEVDELKLKYFTNISHEFRTPLTLILGPLEQLYKSFPTFSSDVKNNLKHIQHNVSHLLRLINQLMDFRKMEEGNLKLSVSEGNLSNFIGEVIGNFDLLAKKKEVSLILNSAEDPSTNFWCDWDKLEKILNNLIHNALSFTPKNGKIIIKVSLYSINDIRNLKIAIIDSGKGINPNELKQIFENFYQANNQTRSFTQGYGIGLSLTKDLVKIHRGTIDVRSDGVNGTTFIIDLPVSKESYTDKELSSESVIDLQHPFNFRNINDGDESGVKSTDESISKSDNKPILLIVDDNIEIRKHLISCFSADYKLVEAENGKEGIEKANIYAPDLIISDVMMPVMDGIEFCEIIKSNIATSHIPVILLTALSSKEHLIEGLETGADIYLTKPFYNEVLQLNVRNLIAARKKLREQFVQTDIMEPSEVTVNSIDERFLTKAMGIVEQNLSDTDYNVEDFVEEMDMGRSAFYRKLKQVSGQAPNEFIRTVRLKRAAQLLKKQSGTIAEISYETGFIDPAYFTRCFKKQFGVTPSEFNNTLKRGE